ncbi:MAG: peptide ABC transporter permease [Calditrichaeota bacterium]|nr:MAG: peptide ABC transporter permease [Calditrichota bacterium]
MHFIEAFKMAMTAIFAHKLRSSLTLLGIVAGVASIIAVMTGISVIQKTIEKEMSVLGATVFQVQKLTRGNISSRAEFLRMLQRPALTMEHVEELRKKAKNVTLVGAELWKYGYTAKYRDIKTNGDGNICGGTPEYGPNNTHYVTRGRTLSREDVKLGRSVVVIGHALAQKLFPFSDPIDKTIKLENRNYRVIGVFGEKKSSFGSGYDKYCLIPITNWLRSFGTKDDRGLDRSVYITVRAKNTLVLDDAIQEVRGILRMKRGVPAREEDNFAYFTNDSQIKNFNEQTAKVKMGSYIIGAIALIVAGIGIMNIMLVSVTERTKEIGLRKSIGAKRRDVLSQFLLEAIVLCNIGGAIGVVVGFGLGNLVSLFTGFASTVPMEWAVGGLVFCTITGLVFGLWPAIVASRKDPILALSYE